MSVLIGISGKIGCGKSTLAAMLAKRLEWRVLSFGGLLKDEVSRVFGFPREWCDTPEGKRAKIRVPVLAIQGAMLPHVATVRQLLQYWGTDVCRAKDPDCWAKMMEGRLGQQSEGVGAIIDDVRFGNEARLVRSRGGILVRLDPYPGWEPGPHAEHTSETALDAWGDWDLRLAPLKGELEAVADAVGDMVLVRGFVNAVAKRIKGLGVADGRS